MREYRVRKEIDSHPNPAERDQVRWGAISLFFFSYLPILLGLLGARILMLYHAMPVVELSIIDENLLQVLDFTIRILGLPW